MTKGEIVRSALTFLGIADYEFDIIPEELATGVGFLNLMMSLWASKGLKIPYNFAGETEDNSGLPDMALEAVATNLALRLAPTYGKQVPLDVRLLAKQGINALYSESAKPRNMQFDWLPAGAGNKIARFVVPEDEYPWIVDDLSDFSGGEADFSVGVIGEVISLSFHGTVDLAVATETTIRYRKPDGTEGTWTGVVSGEELQYTTVEDDIDQDGAWYFQAFAEFADGTLVNTPVESRYVSPVLEGE